ncbi:hypothetical protein NBO_57g0006 [Nosema bombycis CQ1]|uniref:Uncharacterized protein n=1 Tax=Nosema bombycis (strain CQ1 / CVCC 102059) TaxID=578461 RepID=R0M762_NOSB1|nr:hypothetical protein NBO_57g0006 [Nosema bombycis CQ1]|eukprot:EOB13829.1 hypothetical protein NBO_57g0006 [Nosema bombycis CQ1]
MIGLMCNTYTVIIKSSETRANLETDVKIKIDELFKSEVSEQHLKLFVDFNMDIRSTNDYNEMCKYLKILKIPVKDICDLISDSVTGNEITTTEFDQFVPGCPTFGNEHFNSTFETLKYQTEAIDVNIEPSIQKRSLLSVKERINDTTNITSQRFSLDQTVYFLCLVVFITMLFRKLFW